MAIAGRWELPASVPTIYVDTQDTLQQLRCGLPATHRPAEPFLLRLRHTPCLAACR